jgi:hypothetical protein
MTSEETMAVATCIAKVLKGEFDNDVAEPLMQIYNELLSKSRNDGET